MSAMVTEPKRKPRFRPLSSLNALETIVLAAIVLVALAGMMLVGKGLVLQSRVAATPSPRFPLRLPDLNALSQR